MITAPLLRTITAGYRLELDGVHGLAHWARVLENGRRLASVTRADRRVVELFSVLHDSCRVSEVTDPDHGRRGADLARELRGDLFELDDRAFDLLTYACETHTDGINEGDVTVCTCWDADRLDLGRCLIEPDPRLLSTVAARDPALLAWADARAHDFVVPELVEKVWRPMLRHGDGEVPVTADGRTHPPVIVVSDGTGASAERLARSMIVQFGDPAVPVIKLPGACDINAIDHAADLAHRRQAMMVVHTLLVPELRHRLENRCREHGIVTIDFVGSLIDVLSQHLGPPDHFRPGLFRRLHHEYFQRVGAIDFAVRHDDGQRIDQVDQAEMVLLGISRTGKTPLSMYLAMQGWKVANVPLVPGVEPPRQLEQCDSRRMVGLTITPELLVEHRRHREASLGVLPQRYAEFDRVFLEVESARKYFRKRRIPTVDVTNKPIEASAREVVTRITRRLGVENLPGHEL